MNSYFLYIDYTELAPTGAEYHGIKVTDTDGNVIRYWGTGNPPADWRSMNKWAIESGIDFLIESSSVNHFVMDSDEYEFNEEDMLVRTAG